MIAHLNSLSVEAIEKRGGEGGIKGRSEAVTVRVKIITGSLVTRENLFPKTTVTVTVLKLGWITITVTVLAPAVAPSFPLTPSYRLESHLN